MKFEDSQTKVNLETALQGEALAHLKYQFYRSKISNLSEDLAQKLDKIIHNEKEHGKIWFKKLNSGEIPNDIQNLEDAILGEKHEYLMMYPKFAEVAENEGFDDIAELFRKVAEIEGDHFAEFCSILQDIKDDNVFESDYGTATWECLNCGYVHYDTITAPEECPICKHPRKYFKELNGDD